MTKAQQKKKTSHNKPAAGLSKQEKEVADDGTSYFSFGIDDCHLLYNALKQYKPTEEEAQLYDLWLETFDEEIFIHEGSSEGFPVN